MYSDKEIDHVSNIFNALGSRIRLKILMMLYETKKPLHIKAVSRNLDMDYASIYRHVNLLKNIGLIEVFDVGRSRVLSLSKPESLKKIIDAIKL
jgi:DNA-binding transcriptional ArsR family regulator